jgi:uncharacterized protein YjiS (DUF1127 family)
MKMNAKIPVLPIAAGTLARALISSVRRLRKVIRAARNRRDARMLAALDRRMLADMGITRADLNDAFSEPFWEDPTALLRERALERRLYRRN